MIHDSLFENASNIVELLDGDGGSAGTAAKDIAHHPPGMLHRGFSVFLFDDLGRTLLQRRSPKKYHFAGRWSNACCSHPISSVDLVQGASRRLTFELGIDAALSHVGTFRYVAADPVSNLVENEEDAVLVGYIPRDVAIASNPDEVTATRFVGVDALLREIKVSPAAFSPWLLGALDCATKAGHPRR